MINEIANYVLDLQKGLSETRHAEDRSIYQHYLAEAAVMLAKAVKETDIEEMSKLVQTHERLWGHTWLQDEVFKNASKSFGIVKLKLNHK